MTMIGFLVPLAFAARVEVKEVAASSSYPPDGATKYEAAQVIDGKLTTSWVEGDEGSGLGSWVELKLGSETEVKALRVWAGIWYSSSYWDKANRPKDLEVLFSDGSAQKFPLPDKQVVHDLVLSPAVRTSSVKLRVKSVHSGSSWADTAISEVQVLDGQAEHVSVATSAASSKLPADTDGNYEASNATDGLVDSMWCEASKEDGAGEWLEFTFASATKISSLNLVNGMGGSLTYWMKGNRATKATLLFADGSTESVAIKNSMVAQSVPFSPRTTTKVRVTFDEVSKGKEYNDLCISELTFQ